MTGVKEKCPNGDAVYKYNAKKGEWATNQISAPIMKKLKIAKFCTNQIGMTRLYKKIYMPTKKNPNKKIQVMVPVGWLCEGCGYLKIEEGKKPED